MKNNDDKLKARQQLREKLMAALKNNDEDAFVEALDGIAEQVAADIRVDYDGLIAEHDSRVLAARGVRQQQQGALRLHQGSRALLDRGRHLLQYPVLFRDQFARKLGLLSARTEGQIINKQPKSKKGETGK